MIDPPTSAPRLGSLLPTSAPAQGAPLSHLHRDWARPSRPLHAGTGGVGAVGFCMALSLKQGFGRVFAVPKKWTRGHGPRRYHHRGGRQPPRPSKVGASEHTVVTTFIVSDSICSRCDDVPFTSTQRLHAIALASMGWDGAALLTLCCKGCAVLSPSVSTLARRFRCEQGVRACTHDLFVSVSDPCSSARCERRGTGIRAKGTDNPNKGTDDRATGGSRIIVGAGANENSTELALAVSAGRAQHSPCGRQGGLCAHTS